MRLLFRLRLIIIAIGLDRRTAIMLRVHQEFLNGAELRLSEGSPATHIVDCHLTFRP